MSNTRAIILAAGNGSRMGRLTLDRPKAMVAVRGRPLVDRQLSLLEGAGFREITIVVGYQQERLRQHVGDRVRFVENRHYRETNSLYSLWLAANALEEGACVLNCDVLFPAAMLDRLLNVAAPDALLFDRFRPLGQEEMKVQVAGPFVMNMSKEMPIPEADGESVGVVKLGREGGRRLVTILDRLVAQGHRMAWAPLAFARLARAWPLVALDTDGLPWTEIDTPEDLALAEREVAPLIDSAALQSAHA